MTWDTVRALEADGVRFGSHTATHQPLSSLTVGEIASELMTARETLTLQLRRPLTAVAYPYGDVDDVIEQLAGTCGYDFGLTCRGGRALLSDLAIDLPRIDVSGTLTLDEFRRALTR
jgi:peptidoglycan/xylan/chitin deacetylase (PgdA/CDA1 family)